MRDNGTQARKAFICAQRSTIYVEAKPAESWIKLDLTFREYQAACHLRKSTNLEKEQCKT
jgi:hypothetical protein